MSKNIIKRPNSYLAGLTCISLCYCISLPQIIKANNSTGQDSDGLRSQENQIKEMLKQENLPDSRLERILEALIYVLEFECAFDRQQPYYKRLLTLKEKLYGKDSTQLKQCQQDYERCLINIKTGDNGSEGDPSCNSGLGLPTNAENIKMIELPALMKGNILPYKKAVQTIILNAWNLPSDVSTPTVAVCLSKEGKLLKAYIVESAGKKIDKYALHLLRTLTFPAFPKWYDGDPLTFQISIRAAKS